MNFIRFCKINHEFQFHGPTSLQIFVYLFILVNYKFNKYLHIQN